MWRSRNILRLRHHRYCLRGTSCQRVLLSRPIEFLDGVGSGVLRAFVREGVSGVLRGVHWRRYLERSLVHHGFRMWEF